MRFMITGDEDTEYNKQVYMLRELDNMHAGTHIDGPMHLLDVNEYLNEFPLERFIEEGEIVILYIGHGKLYGQAVYFTDYPVMTLAFAELLARKQVKMIVGMDFKQVSQII